MKHNKVETSLAGWAEWDGRQGQAWKEALESGEEGGGVGRGRGSGEERKVRRSGDQLIVVWSRGGPGPRVVRRLGWILLEDQLF